MAGLCAAARARQLGGRAVVYEKGTRPGGSMLLSSGVIWRHREWEDFRAECPGGDGALQRVVWEELDPAIAWLEGLGAPVVAAETGNPRTIGKRFDPRGLTEALVVAGGELRLEEPLRPSAGRLVLATGGFAARLAAQRGLLLRANPWSDGAGLELGLVRGAAVWPGDEFYGRVLPAPPARVAEDDFVGLSQLYGRFAYVLDESGAEIPFDPRDWSETALVQEIARRPAARAWYLLDAEALQQPVREQTVAELVERARAAGGTVLDPSELPFPAPSGYRLAVHVQAAITHTIGGLRVDERARVVDDRGIPVEGLYAAGADVGGISTGGYASGLAAALVLGRIAAESASE